MTLKTKWIAFGDVLGRIFSVVILFIMYFLVIGPVALGGRIFRHDALGLRKKKGAKTYWHKYEEREATIENLQKQW